MRSTFCKAICVFAIFTAMLIGARNSRAADPATHRLIRHGTTIEGASTELAALAPGPLEGFDRAADRRSTISDCRSRRG